MPYTVTRHAQHTVEVAAELDADKVESERRQIVQTFRRRAVVPGFRPGRAPEAAVRARFAADIQAELEQQLTEDVLREVFDAEENLEPLTNPRLKDVGFNDDGVFKFTAELEVRPRYDLPDVAGMELPEVSLEVMDAEVDQELEKIADEHATWEPADGESAVDGMLVEADLEGVMEDSEEEPYSESGARFVLGDESVPEPINRALQGVRIGEKRTAERRFPEDDPQGERAGKLVRYTIDVKALKRKALPPVDDDLAKTVGLEDLAELRSRVAEVVERNKRTERRETWRRHLLDSLEQALDPGDLPASLVQSAVREDLNRFAYSMAMQGVAPDSSDVDWQEMAARFEPRSRKRVLDMLVLEQLAEEWQIATPETELDQYITAEARQLGVPPAEHKANLAKEGRLEGLRHSARISATVEEMIRRAGGEVE